MTAIWSGILQILSHCGIGSLKEDKPVEGSEALFRAIRADLDAAEYRYGDNGEPIITPKAFHDSQLEPSVDRAILRENNPVNARISDSDGVALLYAEQIRTEVGTIKVTVDSVENVHVVDVVPRPLENNPAHAVVTVDPVFSGSNNQRSKAFRRLRIALANIASENGWALPPQQGNES